MDLLKEYFGKHIVLHFGQVDYSSRSSDITPLDFYLLGYVKSQVYLDNLTSIQNITHIIPRLSSEMFEGVIEN